LMIAFVFSTNLMILSPYLYFLPPLDLPPLIRPSIPMHGTQLDFNYAVALNSTTGLRVEPYAGVSAAADSF